MSFDRATLGRTGIEVGRLGVSASYGVPASAVEEAFDCGVNYLYWGSIRRQPFAEALRNLSRRRQQMVLVVQSYSRSAALMRWSVEGALRKVAYDHADVLLLGMWNRLVPPRILDAARRLRERGLVRHLAVSTHNRRLVPALANQGFGIVHVRYSAAHRGAESEVFSDLPDGSPGIVSFTATRWRNLIDPHRVPRGERVPTAADCYRFVLSNPAVDVCMTGPATAVEMREALLAWESGPLPAEDLAWMRRVGDAVH